MLLEPGHWRWGDFSYYWRVWHQVSQPTQQYRQRISFYFMFCSHAVYSALIIPNLRNVFDKNYFIFKFPLYSIKYAVDSAAFCCNSSSCTFEHVVYMVEWETEVTDQNQKRMENSFRRKPQAMHAIYRIYNEWLWMSMFVGFRFPQKSLSKNMWSQQHISCVVFLLFVVFRMGSAFKFPFVGLKIFSSEAEKISWLA